MTTYGHPYHARFSPTKASFSPTSSSSSPPPSSSPSFSTTSPSHRSISETVPPPPLFWKEHNQHPRSVSQTTSTTTSKDFLGGWSREDKAAGAHQHPSLQFGSTTSFASQRGGLLPSPMDVTGSSFDPFSPTHNSSSGLPSKFDPVQRRPSATPSYESSTSTSSSFSSSPYPPPQLSPQRPKRNQATQIPFIFPSRPAPSPPNSAKASSTPTSNHFLATTPPLSFSTVNSPFFTEEETDDSLSYYFTSNSESSSSTPSSFDLPLSPVTVTPTASPRTPTFPRRVKTEEQKYKDDLRNYTRGLLRGVQRAASEPVEERREEGMSAWTRAGGIQDVDMDEEEVLVGGSLGRRRGRGKGADCGSVFREVAVYE